MKMDEIWSIFYGTSCSIEEFNERIVPELYLKPQVHTDVIESFRVIKKLILHSYFEYKFYDIATTQSLLTLEMALKLRYKEINSQEWSNKKRLNDLMDWFEEEIYFEVYNNEYLKRIRQIRNWVAHPSQHFSSGPHTKHIIENVLDLINGLYEDPELRKDRMKLTRMINEKLLEFKNGIRCTINNVTYFAFNAWLAFVNNKKTPFEVYFYFTPTFKFPEGYLEAGNTWIHPQVIDFTGCSIEYSDSSILMKNSENSTLLISEIQNPDEKKEFDNWREKFQRYCHPTGGYFFPNDKIVDTFSFHLRAFYKM